jgi:pilus assembly protein Flp/PilA
MQRACFYALVRVCQQGASVFEGPMQFLNCNNGVYEMRNFIESFVSDESGAAAAEYALILAVVGAGIGLAAAALGTAISTAINNAKTSI